ncbi:uncharacterized protein RAG0_04370 [Rhynchosporium agropyri]|uniref:Uncharacterized protein n=1 Tax=Rhynchosporium agropyri TaxID=914238 RepID=A0A1E1K8E7_9HELO|nr:uncharacterized protein RAG0_04370 [Rhynchosporium agropyri]
MHGLKTLFVNHFGAPSLAKNRMKAVDPDSVCRVGNATKLLDHDSLYCSHLMLTGILQCDSHKFHSRVVYCGNEYWIYRIVSQPRLSECQHTIIHTKNIWLKRE